VPPKIQTPYGSGYAHKCRCRMLDKAHSRFRLHLAAKRPDRRIDCVRSTRRHCYDQPLCLIYQACRAATLVVRRHLRRQSQLHSTRGISGDPSVRRRRCVDHPEWPRASPILDRLGDRLGAAIPTGSIGPTASGPLRTGHSRGLRKYAAATILGLPVPHLPAIRVRPTTRCLGD
jgi:hypothetical protein